MNRSCEELTSTDIKRLNEECKQKLLDQTEDFQIQLFDIKMEYNVLKQKQSWKKKES